MSTATRWRVITPSLLEELPDRPGVFEIGNLVRNVLFIGAAPAGLSAAIRETLREPRLLSRARCLRFEVTEEAEDLARERMTDYRRAHSGAPPYAHRHDPLTSLLDARRPPARALPVARPGRKAGPATFLRTSPDA